MAEQLHTTKGLAATGLERWSARATNSLPVPVGPVIKTLRK